MGIGKTYQGSVYTLLRVDEDRVLFRDRGMLSAGDGERYVHLDGLAALRTRQTLALLAFLKERGVPVAFRRALPDGKLEMDACAMFPLEVVTRRARMGSWLERNPGHQPYWGDDMLVEFFHKKTLDRRSSRGTFIDGNSLRAERAEVVALLKANKQVFPDPLVTPRPGDPFTWDVWDAHALVVPGAALATVEALVPVHLVQRLNSLAREVTLHLAAAFESVPAATLRAIGLEADIVKLADLKIECGLTVDGKLRVADVVNLDSLRLLLDGKFGKEHQLSKQVFRDDADLDAVLEVYRKGALLCEALVA